MPYAKGITPVKKVIPYLEIILKNASQGKPITTLKTDESIKLAAQLREAKAVLKKINHAEYNNKYSYLLPIVSYSFKAYPTYVVAKNLVPIAVEVEDHIPLYNPVHKDIQNTEIDNAIEAIGYLMEHRNLHRVVFTAIAATSLQATILQKWCAGKNYSWSVGEDGFIVEQNDREL